MTAAPLPAVAVIVSLDAAVIEVLVDGFGLPKANLFVEMVSPDCVVDGLAMLHEARHKRLVAPWRLELVDATGRTHQVVATADRDGDRLVVVAATTPAAAKAALREVGPAIDADVQARLQRQLNAASADDRAADERALMELSLTNNELMGLHRQLMSTNAQLQQLDQHKNEVLGMVAHDLRNPLGSIGGFAGAIQHQLGDDAPPMVTTMLQRIERLSGQMLAIVDDLVDVSVIASRQLTLDRGDVDVADLVMETVETHRAAAQQKGLVFVVDGIQAPAVVSGDERRLGQVFDNLVSNAIKYSPTDVEARVQIGVVADDDNVIITIQDEGPGIPADDHEGIFATFYTSRSQPTGGERSVGLGLPITRSIVEAHGGQVRVDSTLGSGSTFTVTLPRHDPDLGTDRHPTSLAR